jgi:DNA-directed RNA polymerase specialized sigma24 family protein
MSDGELIVAMRQRDGAAFAEFFLRFRPLLLHRARRLGVDRSEREERVQDFLTDVALALAAPDGVLPRALRTYLTDGFAHRVYNEVRDRARRERRYRAASLDTGNLDAEAAAILSACSAHSVRESAGGVVWDEVGLSPALERLAATLDEGLSTDERLLLVQVRNHVPLRTIAEWRGVKRDTLKVQLWRLRRRLWEAAQRHADALNDHDRRELDRFFRRTGKMVPRPPAGGSEESAA